MPVGSDLAAIVADFFKHTAGPIGVAVSGGGDSVALLHLLAAARRDLHVVSVDHGLRPEAAAEAAGVAQMAAGLGLAHHTLPWREWDGRGNLMDEARRARQRLIAGWALARGICTVALGHTADDQAETVVMRLARGSGVDGLAGMAPHHAALGVTWVRPLLSVRRQALRDDLVARGVDWVDDPTNDDPHYDRIRVRQALLPLARLGITVEGLTDTAARMTLARQVLDHAVQRLARDAVSVEAGEVCIRCEPLLAEPLETQLRLLSASIRWIARTDYRPRLAAVMATRAAVLAGKRRSLAGCLLGRAGAVIRITREPRAVERAVSATTGLWDNRWRVTGPHAPGLEVRALGAGGLALCPNGRSIGVSRAALVVSPAIWQDTALISAPLAAPDGVWTADIAAGFASFLVSH